jgi:hypothetical protein
LWELEYYHILQAHTLDVMHIAKNVGHQIVEMLTGADADEAAIKSSQSLGLQPALWDDEDPQTPHWPLPQRALSESVKWMYSLALPTAWGNGNKRLFLHPDANNLADLTAVRTVKSHDYHVLLSTGILAIMASWPREDDEPPMDHIAEFVGLVSQAHRIITAETVTFEVMKQQPIYCVCTA